MPRKINIVCVSGTHEKLQMAAMFASVAVATGEMVTVFFSMNAITYFVKGNTNTAPAEGKFGELLSKKGVPTFKKLFQQAVELGDAQLLPCSMALDLLEITQDDLEPEFGAATGLTHFLSQSEGGELLTF